MLHKPFAVAALLAVSCGAQAASDADLAAIRSQIDEMKKSYEQRIAALEKKLAQAELDAQVKPAAQAEARSAGPGRTSSSCRVGLMIRRICERTCLPTLQHRPR